MMHLVMGVLQWLLLRMLPQWLMLLWLVGLIERLLHLLLRSVTSHMRDRLLRR